MKTHLITALAAVTALSLPLSAQLVPPAPGGIQTFAAPTYASNVAQFQADLGDLYFDSDANVPSATINAWTLGPANLAAVFGGTPWLPGGGSVSVTFLGDTAGWQNDFGYSVNGVGAFIPLATDIENNLLTPGGNITSGWQTTVNYAAGTSLEFWLNGVGEGQGGLFAAFGSANQFAGSDVSQHTRFSSRLVTTTFFNGTSVVTQDITTLLIGFEDVRQGVSFYDADFNDFVVAFQFLPTQLPPVPEPSTYALFGSVLLLGLVAKRRLARVIA